MNIEEERSYRLNIALFHLWKCKRECERSIYRDEVQFLMKAEPLVIRRMK